MSKGAVILAVVAVALADKLAPVPLPVAILHSQQVNPDEFGAHSSDFEAENGIKFQFAGNEGVGGGSNMAGSWRYTWLHLNYTWLHLSYTWLHLSYTYLHLSYTWLHLSYACLHLST
ncbi:putative Cuticle protein AMP4-like 4 [Homarus americanus]|uniref:Putative Cuticle protein AMP4-like 4 n=1 Tax=Homarus americanus TaxID=6706 RepID=A0A8J5N9Z5_HOMAM|nr:putative Cuticle protein AMP4-like 4 [Homarus americanus]